MEERLVRLIPALISSNVQMVPIGATNALMRITFTTASTPYDDMNGNDSIETVIRDGQSLATNTILTVSHNAGQTEFRLEGMIASKRPRSGGWHRLIQELREKVQDEKLRLELENIISSHLHGS